MNSYEKIQQEVDRIIDENFLYEPPVDIISVTSNLGLTVFEADFPDKEIAGLIDPKEKIIYVNAEDNENRKIFTIAHELGHWVLHLSKLKDEPDKYAILYRKPIGSINDDIIEREANYFAAHLLVPKKMLDKYKNSNNISIANIFGVSKDVIGYRKNSEYGS